MAAPLTEAQRVQFAQTVINWPTRQGGGYDSTKYYGASPADIAPVNPDYILGTPCASPALKDLVTSDEQHSTANPTSR